MNICNFQLDSINKTLLHTTGSDTAIRREWKRKREILSRLHKSWTDIRMNLYYSFIASPSSIADNVTIQYDIDHALRCTVTQLV